MRSPPYWKARPAGRIWNGPMSDHRAFLNKVGWGEAEIAPLPGDASTRRYARLRHGARQAMLMDQPQGAESAVAAPDADETTRRKLGYNAVARLAGADCRRFAAVANYLRARGLSAPDILAADYGQGLLVIEDLGDDLFTEIVNGANGEAQYKEHRMLWKTALDAIQGSDIVFVHRDYHAQNLLWLPEREDLGRVGLIDFQD